MQSAAATPTADPGVNSPPTDVSTPPPPPADEPQSPKPEDAPTTPENNKGAEAAPGDNAPPTANQNVEKDSNTPGATRVWPRVVLMVLRLFAGIALALFAFRLYTQALESIRKEGLVIRRYSGGFGGNSTRWQISSPLLFMVSAFAVLGVAVTVAFYGVEL